VGPRPPLRITRLGRVVALLIVCGVIVSTGVIWRVTQRASGATTPAAVGVATSSPAARQPKAAPAGPLEDSEPGKPGTEAWAITVQPQAGEVAGYTDPASVKAGEQVALFVSSTAATVTATAYRIGGYTGGRGRQIWQGTFTGGVQPPAEVSESTRTVLAAWRPSIRISTVGWPAGFYLIKLVAATGGQWQVPFVVRSDTSAGRVALVLPLTTWQAYNDWGGLSLYHGSGGRSDFSGRSYAVSFDRPYPSPGAGEFLYSALPMVAAAERDGVPLAYLANTDLQSDPQALTAARGYVSVGHDEYWTPLMRQRVTAARDSGTNLLITGANTMDWRVRLQPGLRNTGPDRLVVGYKNAQLDPQAGQDPIGATAHFADPPAPDSQQSLIGTRYECFPADTSWTVTTPSWWGFDGSDLKPGEAFAHLLAVEADRVYPGTGTPRPMQIIADAAYTCRGRPTTAQAIYYTAPSGAGVVNLDSLRWTCALDPGCRDGNLTARTNQFVTVVTKNVLRAFSQGPLGPHFPVADNLDSFTLPSTRTVYPDN